jgi:hypothetical protein
MNELMQKVGAVIEDPRVWPAVTVVALFALGYVVGYGDGKDATRELMSAW